MKKYLVFFLLLSGAGYAQEYIEDNSFFIEEAYNQDPGVVQHISNAQWFAKFDLFQYSFTQEWPLLSMKHQLSYTLPVLSGGGDTEFGDVLLNYRYQLFTKEHWAAVSPRFTIILPTSDASEDAGFQVNLPVSKRISPHWIAHWNGGATVWIDDPIYNVGGSLIWQPVYGWNAMLEYTALIVDAEDSSNITTHTLSPGLRFAIDRGNLQIVPGIAAPITFENGDADIGLFLYLSFEHPF